MLVNRIMKMKLFPTLQRQFKLINDSGETLNRLNRRTDRSEKLISGYTDKSFRGIINGNEFKIISSVVGIGAFCVMSGVIELKKGNVKVEIHKVFRVLLSIILLFPLVGFVAMTTIKLEVISSIFILVTIGQILMIRYLFVGTLFRVLAKLSLNKLRDILDLEWVKN